MPTYATTDLCDAHPEIQVCDPVFQTFGGAPAFSGPITTLKVFEDNTLIKQAVESPGEGRVLVVDGGGSKRCGLVGGNLAVSAATNGWAGIVVYGCIRDADELAEQPLGVRALGGLPAQERARAALGSGRPPGDLRRAWSSARGSGWPPTATASSCCRRSRRRLSLSGGGATGRGGGCGRRRARPASAVPAPASRPGPRAARAAGRGRRPACRRGAGARCGPAPTPVAATPARPASPSSFQRRTVRNLARVAELALDKAVELTRTGDVWVFRGPSLADRAIRALTNAPVNHVGMAVVLEDMPPLLWHAELGRSLPDAWTGEHQRGVQLHDLRDAVTHLAPPVRAAAPGSGSWSARPRTAG